MVDLCSLMWHREFPADSRGQHCGLFEVDALGVAFELDIDFTVSLSELRPLGRCAGVSSAHV